MGDLEQHIGHQGREINTVAGLIAMQHAANRKQQRLSDRVQEGAKTPMHGVIGRKANPTEYHAGKQEQVVDTVGEADELCDLCSSHETRGAGV